MKKVIVISIALLVIGVSNIHAQIAFGARVGFSRPTVSGGDGKVDGKFGLEAGPVLYYSIKNNLYINSGLLFSMKTFDEQSTNTSYLELPLYIGYRIPIGKLDTYAQAGPYIGYKLSEKNPFSDILDESNVEYFENIDLFNSFDAGAGLMLGVNLKRFKIEAGYQYGFTNIINRVIGSSARLNSLFLGVSYVF
jgi:hypothetical protein